MKTLPDLINSIPRNSTLTFAVELVHIKFRQRALNWDEAIDSSHSHPYVFSTQNQAPAVALAYPIHTDPFVKSLANPDLRFTKTLSEFFFSCISQPLVSG